ncbi:hypothetical protein RhiJN_27061 [Ceratobasidium sp. AG-Ba]|nr:hypothetical protein RhiJN_27061 [Ceratobasidium sp. AG-Ba]
MNAFTTPQFICTNKFCRAAASFAGEKKYIESITWSTSDSNARDQSKPRPQPKPRPLPSTTETATHKSSTIAHTNDQSDDEDILRDSTPVATHDKGRTRGKSSGDVDDEMAEPENGKLGGKTQPTHALAPDVEGDDEGSSKVQGSVRTSEASKKRKPMVGEGAREEDLAAKEMLEDELPVKKPRLTRRSIIQNSSSDDEREHGGAGDSEGLNNKQIDERQLIQYLLHRATRAESHARRYQSEVDELRAEVAFQKAYNKEILEWSAQLSQRVTQLEQQVREYEFLRSLPTPTFLTSPSSGQVQAVSQAEENSSTPSTQERR